MMDDGINYSYLLPNLLVSTPAKDLLRNACMCLWSAWHGLHYTEGHHMVLSLTVPRWPAVAAPLAAQPSRPRPAILVTVVQSNWKNIHMK